MYVFKQERQSEDIDAEIWVKIFVEFKSPAFARAGNIPNKRSNVRIFLVYIRMVLSKLNMYDIVLW